MPGAKMLKFANCEPNPVQEAQESPQARPFVKWVGGKTQLLEEIHHRLPRKINRYFEPFVGGGAVFFSLGHENATLIDINEELVNAYQVIRDNVDALIKDLKKHEYSEEYFYRIRDKDRSKDFQKWSDVRRASRLIFLNKTCFNGLYRVNSEGFFNTPFGRYFNPRILDEENLRACSKALKSVEILHGSFMQIDELAKKGDFVYFDPPYAPVSETAYFTSYSKEGFAVDMQLELRDLCLRLNKKGVKFMLSNADVPLIRELYSDKFNIEVVMAFRSVNSVATKRGKVREVIITNYSR
jgi:DNA adenine methylase